MKKLSNDELLEEFNRIFTRWGGLVGKEKQAYQQIRKLITEKPKVTEAFVWEAIKYIQEYPTYNRLATKLKEAGIEIEEKK